MKNQLRNFTEKFFMNLGAKVLLQGDILLVTQVPKEFEKFYGKTSPYKFTFSKENEDSEIELIEKGSYPLKSMQNYLENSGQITLLKIDFNINPEEEIKKKLKLRNSHIESLRPRKKFAFFFRFTFHTIFQYLNQREKLINEIYVHEGKPITGNLNNYPVIEGKKEEINIPDMKEPYFIAKEELKERLKEKTEEISGELKRLLENEIERVNLHFEKEGKELNSMIEKNEERLIELKKENDPEKIERQKKILENLKSRLNYEEREKDKERTFFIEKQKHSLNLNNKLFNTTLIYHPLFTYDCTLKSTETKETIEVSFNPLKEEIGPIKCDVCKEKTNEINLCSEGHIICKNCIKTCESCQKVYCKNCVKNKCDHCGKNICNDCKTKCSGCGKIICKTHVTSQGIYKRIYCNDCLRRCERCGGLREKSTFRKSQKTGAEICENCYLREVQNSVLKGVFE